MNEILLFIYTKIYIYIIGVLEGVEGGGGACEGNFPHKALYIYTTNLKSGFIPKPTKQLYMSKNI